MGYLRQNGIKISKPTPHLYIQNFWTHPQFVCLAKMCPFVRLEHPFHPIFKYLMKMK